MLRRGTARTPPAARLLRQVSVHRRMTSSCDYATLGSKPREPPSQSMPPLPPKKEGYLLPEH
jgi:hypothetical protein